VTKNRAVYPKRFRPKATVEAIQITDDLSIASITGWMGAYGIHPIVHGETRPFGLEFVAASGNLVVANPGDWVVRGVTGKFFPYHGEGFNEFFEEIP
jgi:hypothetical protein